MLARRRSSVVPTACLASQHSTAQPHTRPPSRLQSLAARPASGVLRYAIAPQPHTSVLSVAALLPAALAVRCGFRLRRTFGVRYSSLILVGCSNLKLTFYVDIFAGFGKTTDLERLGPRSSGNREASPASSRHAAAQTFTRNRPLRPDCAQFFRQKYKQLRDIWPQAWVPGESLPPAWPDEAELASLLPGPHTFELKPKSATETTNPGAEESWEWQRELRAMPAGQIDIRHSFNMI